MDVLGNGLRDQAGVGRLGVRHSFGLYPSLVAGAGGGDVGCSEMEVQSWHRALMGLILFQ